MQEIYNMTSFITKIALAPVAVSFALVLAVSAPASADTAVRKGGVTSVRYVGTGAKQAEVDEGWTMAVPVDRSGPIYVVDNGDPTLSPVTLIGAPIRAVGTVAQLPFKIIGAPFGG